MPSAGQISEYFLGVLFCLWALGLRVGPGGRLWAPGTAGAFATRGRIRRSCPDTFGRVPALVAAPVTTPSASCRANFWQYLPAMLSLPDWPRRLTSRDRGPHSGSLSESPCR